MPRNNTQRLSLIVNDLAENCYFSGNKKGAQYVAPFFWCDPKELEIEQQYRGKFSKDYSHLHICTNNDDPTNAVQVDNEVVESVIFHFTLRPNGGLDGNRSEKVKITPDTTFYFGNADGAGEEFEFEISEDEQSFFQQACFVEENFIDHEVGQDPKQDIRFVYYSNDGDERIRLFDFSNNNWYGDNVEKCRIFYMDFLNAVLGLSKVCRVSKEPGAFDIPTKDEDDKDTTEKWSTIWARSADEGDLDIAV